MHTICHRVLNGPPNLRRQTNQLCLSGEGAKVTCRGVYQVLAIGGHVGLEVQMLCYLLYALVEYCILLVHFSPTICGTIHYRVLALC